MSYISYIPSPLLRPYVASIAITEADDVAEYKVLPGTGLVIGFQFRGSISKIEGGEPKQLSSSGVTGLHDSYHTFMSASGTGSVLVYFKEGGASAFFGQPIHELFRESVSLENFMLRSELLLLEEQLCEAMDKVKVVEAFLLSRLKHTEPDKLVMAALALIHKSKGTIRIKELAEQLHTSASPLEKRFRSVVGASPKKFASIVRFKHTLQAFSNAHSLTGLSYEAGYYDQAHFIKEFKSFTGEAPGSFFKK